MIPSSLLEDIDIERHPEILMWWESLSDVVQQSFRYPSVDADPLHTIGTILNEEDLPEVYDDAGDLYEYLVNHEHRPIGPTLGYPGRALPGISLLAPLWPPYPIAVRYRAWQLSDELMRQLESGFRFLR